MWNIWIEVDEIYTVKICQNKEMNEDEKKENKI